jgi:hypothetical protein
VREGSRYIDAETEKPVEEGDEVKGYERTKMRSHSSRRAMTRALMLSG